MAASLHARPNPGGWTTPTAQPANSLPARVERIEESHLRCTALGLTRVERPDFEQIVPNYHKRFDLVISEDNGIAELQLQGLSNPLSQSGRFSAMEPLVHTIDNWILDRVIGPLSAAQRTAAE